MTGNGWLELSHPIDEGAPKVPFLPRPRFEPIDDASLRATRVSLATHVGTHIEAPRHLQAEGRTIDEYPAERWISRGQVCRVDAEPLEEIGPEDLNPPEPLQAGDAVLIQTGWAEHVGTKAYYRQPYLSPAAAEWLVDHSPSWVGIDSPSPEMPVDVRGDDFSYPVHATLLDNDVPIAEHLTNLPATPSEPLEVIALPLLYAESDAAHARIVARPYDEPR